MLPTDDGVRPCPQLPRSCRIPENIGCTRDVPVILSPLLFRRKLPAQLPKAQSLHATLLHQRAKQDPAVNRCAIITASTARVLSEEAVFAAQNQRPVAWVIAIKGYEATSLFRWIRAFVLKPRVIAAIPEPTCQLVVRKVIVDMRSLNDV